MGEIVAPGACLDQYCSYGLLPYFPTRRASALGPLLFYGKLLVPPTLPHERYPIDKAKIDEKILERRHPYLYDHRDIDIILLASLGGLCLVNQRTGNPAFNADSV